MGVGTCERCHRRPAAYVVVDEPEEEGYRNGDAVLELRVCTPCLVETQAEGPWTSVVDLTGRAA